jgi:hypothetical protein
LVEVIKSWLVIDPGAGAQIAAPNLYRRTGKPDRKGGSAKRALRTTRQARFTCEIQFAR